MFDAIGRWDWAPGGTTSESSRCHKCIRDPESGLQLPQWTIHNILISRSRVMDMLRSCDVLGTSWSTWPRIQLRAAVAMCQFVHGARARWAHRRRYDVKYLVLARAKSCHFIKPFSKQDTKKESISWCYMDRERSLVHKLLLKKTKEMFISIDGYQEKDLRLFGRLFPSALYISICWEQFFLGLRERRHAPSCNISADHKMISSLNKCKIMSESRNVCSGVACMAATASSNACLARWHARSGLPQTSWK